MVFAMRGIVLLFPNFYPMEARQLAAALLNCGVLDADFLLELIDCHGLCIHDLLDDVANYR
jgi:hypothetical protein